MASVELILRQAAESGNRNVRVVHWLRDPRAVALSRMREGDPLLGKHASQVLLAGGIGSEEETVAREAKLFCRSVAADVKLRQRLDAEYPGSILTMWFEEAAMYLKGQVRAIYRFMNETIPRTTLDWMHSIAAESQKKAEAWRHNMTVLLNDRILNGECRELCDLVGCF